MAGVSSRYLRQIGIAAARIEAQCPVCSLMDAEMWLRVPIAQIEGRMSHLPFGFTPFGIQTLNWPGFPWNVCMAGHIWRADIKTHLGPRRLPTHVTVEPYVLGISDDHGR